MEQYANKTALITGASSGIGEAFAYELARRGANVILVARSVDRLQSIANDLRSRHHVHVHVVPADLSQAGAAETITQALAEQQLHVDILINNAGFATHGQFEDLDAERDHQQVMVNVASVVDLCHAFIAPMVRRGSGTIINVASTVAYQPTPFMAVYGASKAFVTSFSVALHEEYRERGVRVLAVCPGATATNFFATVGSDSVALGQMRTSAQVVATTFRALERGRSVVVDGRMNALIAEIGKRASFGFAARIAARITRPQTATITNQRVDA